MSYRADFWISAVAGFSVQMLIAACLWRSVFASSGVERIGEYDLPAMMRYYVLVLLFGRIVAGSGFGGEIAQEIYEGGYTRYLVYPSGYLPFKYAQHLGQMVPAGVQLVLFGALTPLLLPFPDPSPITLASAGMAALSLLAANLLLFLLLVPVQAAAFWADNVWALMVMVRIATHLLGGLLLPLDLFPEWAREALAWTPFPYLYSFPVRALLGQLDPASWALGLALALAWCLGLGALARAVWSRGDRTYTGVGI